MLSTIGWGNRHTIMAHMGETHRFDETHHFDKKRDPLLPSPSLHRNAPSPLHNTLVEIISSSPLNQFVRAPFILNKKTSSIADQFKKFNTMHRQTL